MSTDLATPTRDDLDQAAMYRALSSAAVASLVLGLLSVVTIPAGLTSMGACLLISPVPLVGLLIGLRALTAIRARPDELTGGRVAWAGVLLSGSLLATGWGLAGFVYATEVPDGYTRLTFGSLKPDESPEHSSVLVPPEIMNFEGQKIFIKGYMRPSSQYYELDRFLLVRDNNECCFGQNLPAYYDQIEVTLVSPLRTDYSTRMFRMGGTLEVNATPDAFQPGQAVYKLTADYLQ